MKKEYKISKSINILTSSQIHAYSEFYQRKLARISTNYALKLKMVIENEYGRNFLNIENLHLSTHFEFRFDKYIRKVTHLKRDRAVGSDILNRVRAQITRNYNNLKKRTATMEASFKKLSKFIEFYLDFSEYVSSKSGKGKFSISNLKYEGDSKELAPKSWLLENLRYLFPKKFGLPIRDDLLSWFLFRDIPEYGRVCKVKWKTEGKELFKRIYLFDLLSIDYRVFKLTTNDFKEKGIKISRKALSKLQENLSYIILLYVFGSYHESTYVSKTTNKGLEVGQQYFTPEYYVIRAVFFAVTESNDGVSLTLEAINRDLGVTDLKARLYQGYGFGDDLKKLLKYIDGLLLNSEKAVIQTSKETLKKYINIYEVRRKELLNSLGFKSTFQGRVYNFMNDLFGVEFISEKQVASTVNAKKITTVNDDGNREVIKIHGGFSFDGYLKLNKALKEYFKFDDKWIGIAFEAMGKYWHILHEQQECDRKKRFICKEKNVILLEIWENWDDTVWMSKILSQIKDQTGVILTNGQISKLKYYLGDTKNIK